MAVILSQVKRELARVGIVLRQPSSADTMNSGRQDDRTGVRYCLPIQKFIIDF